MIILKPKNPCHVFAAARDSPRDQAGHRGTDTSQQYNRLLFISKKPEKMKIKCYSSPQNAHKFNTFNDYHM